VEHVILQNAQDQTDLHVQEIVSTALSWIRNEIRFENVHIGPISDCLSEKHTFDVIYLSAVDYALSDYQLRNLFKTLQSHLKPHGEFLILSASFSPMVSRWRVPLVFLKGRLADILGWLNLRPRGQFWGWARTQHEYYQLFSDSGFTQITDGFVSNVSSNGDYWISGRCLNPETEHIDSSI
jgi:hypothetical protein